MMIFVEVGAPFLWRPLIARHGHVMQWIAWGWFGVGFSGLDMGELLNGVVEAALERQEKTACKT